MICSLPLRSSLVGSSWRIGDDEVHKSLEGQRVNNYTGRFSPACTLLKRKAGWRLFVLSRIHTKIHSRPRTMHYLAQRGAFQEGNLMPKEDFLLSPQRLKTPFVGVRAHNKIWLPIQVRLHLGKGKMLHASLDAHTKNLLPPRAQIDHQCFVDKFECVRWSQIDIFSGAPNRQMLFHLLRLVNEKAIFMQSIWASKCTEMNTCFLITFVTGRFTFLGKSEPKKSEWDCLDGKNNIFWEQRS